MVKGAVVEDFVRDYGSDSQIKRWKQRIARTDVTRKWLNYMSFFIYFQILRSPPVCSKGKRRKMTDQVSKTFFSIKENPIQYYC